MVLIDTSVWIEFFKSRPSINIIKVQELLLNKKVVTNLLIRAEVLSGAVSHSNLKIVELAFDALTYVDLDWARPEVWSESVSIAHQCKKSHLSIPSLVDRLILLSGQYFGVKIWTLDKKLIKVAKSLKLGIYEA